jgi:hypothetical protein
MNSRSDTDRSDPIRARRRRLLLLLLPALLIAALGVAILVLTDDGDSTPFVYTVF